MAARSPSKTRTTSARPGPTEAATSGAPQGRASIRMYGQGLGDCFLLAFPRAGVAGAPVPGRPVYVLIDCGVVAGTPDGPERMRQIVRDIRETTRDDTLEPVDGAPRGHLDLLIITHEHWDHLSGFVQAADEWRTIQVDALWTAWTEKDEPGGLPEVLRTIVEKQQRTLAAIADRALRFGQEQHHETVLGLMAFHSDAAMMGQPFGTAVGVRSAFNAAKSLVTANKRPHICCEPGEVRRVPGTEALAYVLGPPRNSARLRQANPSRQNPETYENGGATGAGGQEMRGRASADARATARLADLDAAFSVRRMLDGRSTFNSFAMSLLDPSLAASDAEAEARPAKELHTEKNRYERSFPFASSVRIPLPLSELAAQGRPKAYPILESYFDEVHHWRRIDFDWLAPAEVFALQADTLTNNTSLVLAFELPPSADNGERKVLLFVGDAQVGNWLSWDEIPAWLPQDGVTVATTKPDIGDLLKRAVFYKVGHHGSHNATLKERGVERMRDDGKLTAFVPVSPIVARDLKDWCQMPLDSILGALSQRTKGRVVLPTGNLWPPLTDGQLAQEHKRFAIEVSTDMLPPKIRQRDQKQIEEAVPLWTQIAID